MTEPDIHFIPMLKVDRWILDKANAFGSSSQDDAARFESGALGEEGDGLTDVEYLIAETKGYSYKNSSKLLEKETDLRGCTILNSVPVECTFQENFLWIRDGIAGYDTWAKGVCVI